MGCYTAGVSYSEYVHLPYANIYMYASSSKTTKVNVLRHELFLTIEVKLIPTPSRLARTVFSSTHNHITKQEYGRWLCNEILMCQNPTVVVGSLKIDWMDGHAAPDAVL